MTARGDRPSRQPVALYVLALTELWERFSYYGMRAILILYMTEYLLLPGHERWVAGMAPLRRIIAAVSGMTSGPAVSSQIYGLYTGLAYFTPVLGGVIADRWLGQRRSVIGGGLLMAAGQFALLRDDLFLAGLALLIAGNGLFKPNIVSQVGRLYADGDTRRDRAYSTFYVGINIGACIAPLACGAVAQVYGWHAAFALGGVGMMLGLAVFIGGARLLPVAAAGDDSTVNAPVPRADDVGRRIALLTLLGVLLSLFFAVFEQLGNAFSLWMRDHTDHMIGGDAIPIPWFQSANPMLMILLTPLLVTLWERQARRGAEASTIVKITLGFAMIALAYLLLAGCQIAFAPHKVTWLVVVPFLLLLTWGELHISPTSLSLFSRIAPPGLISTTMGIYFLAAFVGNIVAGWLGAYAGAIDPAVYWLIVAGMAAAGAAAGGVLTIPVNRFLAHREIAR